MAEPLETGILYLLSEFFTHTFEIFRSFKAAGAIASRSFKAFLYGTDYFLIGI